MNILFFAQDVTPSARSGDAVHVRELASNLAALGHSVTVIGRDLEDVSENEYKAYQKELEDLEGDNLKFILIKTKLKLSYHPVKISHTLVEGLKVLRSQKVDLIYSRSFDCKLEALLSQIFNVPLVLELNGIEHEEAKLLGKKAMIPIQEGLRLRINRFFLKFPNGIIVVTEMLKKVLVGDYLIPPEKIYVVHNGANIILFKPMSQTDSKRELGLDYNRKHVCFVGSLEPWQGIGYLIKSIPLVFKDHDNVNFLIVGDGALRSEMEKLSRDLRVRDRMIFTGRVPYSRVPLYINASDICVAPFTNVRNKKIGLSALKIYEYLACGKPVVASDIEGVGDLLTGTKSGIAVKPEDERELANALSELLSSEELRRNEMGKRGRKAIIEWYNWKSVANSVSSILKETKAGY